MIPPPPMQNKEAAELIGYLNNSISGAQTTGIEIRPLKDRMGKAYPKGSPIYIYRRCHEAKNENKIIDEIAEAFVWVAFMSIAYGIATTLSQLANYLHNSCYK